MSFVKGYLPQSANAWVYKDYTLSFTLSDMVPRTLLMPMFSICDRPIATSVVHNKSRDRRDLLHSGKVVPTVPIGPSLYRRVEILRHRAMLPSCLIPVRSGHARTFRSSVDSPCSPHDVTECIRPDSCILHVIAQLMQAAFSMHDG